MKDICRGVTTDDFIRRDFAAILQRFCSKIGKIAANVFEFMIISIYVISYIQC